MPYSFFEMGCYAYTYQAGKRSRDYRVRYWTSAALGQVRPSRDQETYETLYDGNDLQRYPGHAIAGSLKSELAAVITTNRPVHWKDPLPHHLEEVFGLDPLTFSAEPRLVREPVRGTWPKETPSPRSEDWETRAQKRTSLHRKLKSLAKLFRCQTPVCSEV